MSEQKGSGICILLASYNGGDYLREQVQSIQAQSLTDWTLLVRDDNSTDNSRDVLQAMAKNDQRIQLLQQDSAATGGARANFNRLLLAGLESRNSLFFLCDQDDVWEPEKLALQCAHFPENGNEATPRLVHTDLTVVDHQLRPLHASFVRHMALDPQPEKPLNYLLSRNFVTGCTAACNRRLLELALPIPVQAIMHDWWLAAVASCTGDIQYLHRPMTRYRQHAENTIGAVNAPEKLSPKNNWARQWQTGNEEFLATFGQARALYQHPRLRLKERWPAQILRDYVHLLDLPRHKRPSAAFALGVREDNLLLQCIFYLRLLTVSRPDPVPGQQR